MFSKPKKVKYWTIVSFPLVYFASIQDILSRTSRSTGVLGVEDNPMFAYIDRYNFFLNTVRTAGGIMFGVIYQQILHCEE